MCVFISRSNNSRNSTSDLQKDSAALPFEEHLEICLPSIYNQCVGTNIDFSRTRQICRGHNCCFCPNYAERFQYCQKRGKSQDAHDEFQCCKDSSLCGIGKRNKQTKKVDSKTDVTKIEEKNEKLDSNNKPVIIDNADDKTPPAASEGVESKKEGSEEEKQVEAHTRTSVENAASTKTDPIQPKEDKNIPPPEDEILVITPAPTIENFISSVIINVSSLRDIQPTKTMQAIDVVDKTKSAESSSSSSSQIIVATKTEVPKLEPTQDVNQKLPSQDGPLEKTPSVDQIKTEINSAAEIEDKDKPQSISPEGDSSSSAEKPVEKDKTEEEQPKTSSKPEVPAKQPESSTKTDSGVKQPLKTNSDIGTNSASGNSGGIFIEKQKESVFMRLNNRIKDLELNMSLSSRYLEELSQR